MENIFMLAEVRAEAVQRGYHVRLQRLLDAPSTPKIVQKFIASALVQLLEEGATSAQLWRAIFSECAMHCSCLVLPHFFGCILAIPACFHLNRSNTFLF
jgi:hypothetical protein